MYGDGFEPEGDDECTPASGFDRSFVYRISLETLEIDDAYRVGAVPKVVAVTPDGRYVLVANWCTWDLSVISTREGREVRRIEMGPIRGGSRSPRTGTPPTSGSWAATTSSASTSARGRRRRSRSGRAAGARDRPVRQQGLRHPQHGRAGCEARPAHGRGQDRRHRDAAAQPRLADDGKAIYVVNYESGTVTQAADARHGGPADDRRLLHPIGITYDAPTRRVWVACYGGSILVYDDRTLSDGASGIRTRDLLAASQTLSQLSYGPARGKL